MFNKNKESLDKLIPKGVPQNSTDLGRPSAEEIQLTTQQTKSALDLLIHNNIHSKPSLLASSSSQFLSISSSNTSSNSKTNNRIVKLTEQQTDPLAPPRFKAKKLPRASSSPPPPVLHSPPRKVSAAEQASWKIPPCISNWKNPKGFTISLDKRVLTDGKALQPTQVSENFSKLSESLYVADQHAREELEKRSALQKLQAEQERSAKEEYLRDLARKARADKSNRDLMSSNCKREVSDEHQQESGKKIRFTKEVMYDHRLFNQNAGIESGFVDDEDYNLYDRPLFKGSSSAYKPTVNNESVKREGPVQFEKDSDPFGVESFLNEARNATSKK